MRITVEFNELSNGFVEARIKYPPQHGSKREVQYCNHLAAALKECVLPSIIKNLGGTVLAKDTDNSKGDNSGN